MPCWYPGGAQGARFHYGSRCLEMLTTGTPVGLGILWPPNGVLTSGHWLPNTTSRVSRSQTCIQGYTAWEVTSYFLLASSMRQDVGIFEEKNQLHLHMTKNISQEKL